MAFRKFTSLNHGKIAVLVVILQKKIAQIFTEPIMLNVYVIFSYVISYSLLLLKMSLGNRL